MAHSIQILLGKFHCVDGIKSLPVLTTEGIKQGGILSPFLFNFFIDDLLSGCRSLDIGALVGVTNTSILAYCDDILLLSSNESHMQRLLNNCFAYSRTWKMEFNASKSIAYSLRETRAGYFYLNNMPIPPSIGFIYLGLPIGDQHFIEQFF